MHVAFPGRIDTIGWDIATNSLDGLAVSYSTVGNVGAELANGWMHLMGLHVGVWDAWIQYIMDYASTSNDLERKRFNKVGGGGGGTCLCHTEGYSVTAEYWYEKE